MLSRVTHSGVYSRPVAGSVDSANHANDRTSLTEHRTPDFLQYYGIGIGKVKTPGSYTKAYTHLRVVTPHNAGAAPV